MDRTLIVMRHGHYDYPNLTQRGELQSMIVAQQLANDNVKPDLILHSPVTRAVQTAEQVLNVFNGAGHTPEMKVVPWLHEDRVTSPASFNDIAADKRVVLLVTHQPNVEDLTDAFDNPQVPGHANAYVFTQHAANWTDFQKGALQKKYTPGM